MYFVMFYVGVVSFWMYFFPVFFIVQKILILIDFDLI